MQLPLYAKSMHAADVCLPDSDWLQCPKMAKHVHDGPICQLPATSHPTFSLLSLALRAFCLGSFLQAKAQSVKYRPVGDDSQTADACAHGPALHSFQSSNMQDLTSHIMIVLDD
jgi:hypothetical protein